MPTPTRRAVNAMVTALLVQSRPTRAASAFDFLPADYLSADDRSALHRATTSIKAAAVVLQPYTRHGGAYKLLDRPTGGKMVLPVHLRRVRIVDGFRAHLDAASTLPFLPDARLRASSLPPDLAAAVRFVVGHSHELRDVRGSAAALIRSWAAELRPISAHINALMPPSVLWIAARVNTALMGVLIDALQWLDTSLVSRFVHGFPVVGTIPDSGVYRLIEPPATAAQYAERYSQFQLTAPAWIRTQSERIDARATASQAGRTADLAVAAKSQSELAKGAIRGPYLSPDALDRAVRAAYPGMPLGLMPRPLDRFGVPQKGSIRAIDDGKQNGANRATFLLETVTLPTFAFPAVIARAIYVASQAQEHDMPDMTVFLADLMMAYRTVPSSQPWYTSIAFYNPAPAHGARPRREYYYLPGHNFGLTAAVINFNRYPEFVVVVCRSLGAVLIDHYVDDYIGPDLTSAGSSSLRLLETIMEELGPGKRTASVMRTRVQSPELDPDKTFEPAASRTVLGVECDLERVASDHAVLFTPSPERVASILKDFRRAFVLGRLSPAEAAKLRGRIFFVLTSAFGAVGRAATLPLVQRQYRDTDSAFIKGSELHHCLLFFEALLPNLPPLTITLAPPTRRPLLVYTDAAFWLRKLSKRGGDSRQCAGDRLSRLRGGLGVLIYDPEDGTARYAYGKPDWPTLMKHWPDDKKTYIAQLEVLAAIAVYFTYPEVFAGRAVNHFIDNAVALSALVNGYSGKPDLARMVNAFYLQAAGLRTSVYFEYVPSKANIADLPSRDAITELLAELEGDAHSPPIPLHPSDRTHTLRVPGLAEWSSPLSSWLLRHTHIPAEWHV